MRENWQSKIFIALVAAQCAWAQIRGSSGIAVSGLVVDPSSAIIPGAVVSLWSHGQKQSEIATDTHGAFLFENVTRGRYELHVAFSGFKPFSQRIQIADRAPAPVRISLSLSDVQETVDVQSYTGGVSSDVSENLNSVRMGTAELQNLPMLGNDVVAALTRALGPSAAGGGATVIVDGMPSTEKGILASDIQEIRINKNPYSAEFARPGRNRIEIITKSGGTKYHGSLYAGFRDYRADARDAFALERQPEQRRQFEGTLSGPLGNGKKTNFSLSMGHNTDDLRPSVYAIGLQGPIFDTAPQTQSSTYFSTQVTRRVNGNNTFSLRYSYYDWLYKGQGTGGLSLPETGAISSARYNQIYSTWKTVVSPKLLNELLVRGRIENSDTSSVRPGVPKLVVLGAVTTGGAQLDQTGNDHRGELNDTVSWTAGSHVLKAGLNVPAIGRQSSVDRSNAQGTFYFSSLNDYRQARPYSFLQQAGMGRLTFWEKQVAAFVQDDFRVRPNFSISLGLRYDRQNYLNDRNNFAPRLSFAFSPDKKRKTVFRGGAGIFYEFLPGSVIGDMLRLQAGSIQQILVSDPLYPAPYPAGLPLAALPPTLFRLDPRLRSPYNLQYSFALERELRKSLSLSITYSGIRGIDIFRSLDVNAPFAPSLSRPNPQFGQFRQIESSGVLKNNALQTAIQGNLSRFFKGMVLYEFAHTRNNTDGVNSFPANSWDLRGEWSVSSNDVRHYVYLYGTITAGKFLNVGVFFSARSGLPYSMVTGRDNNGDGLANDRPAGVPRNNLRGSESSALDLRWSKEFTPSERVKGFSLVFSVDAFNVLNTVSYSSFVGNISSPLFRQPVSAAPGRRLQGAMTAKF